MRSKLYLLEEKFKIKNNVVHAIVGIKETGLSAIIEKFCYLAEWFSIGFLFYLNTQFIHSKLFGVFVFICGVVLLQTLGIKKKLTTKQEFLEKVNNLLKEEG